MSRSSPFTRFWSLAAFLRPQIAFQASLYCLVGVYLSGTTTHNLRGEIFLAALTVALLVSFGFVVNDYADRELDRLVKPHRPLPSGRVTVSEARFIALALSGVVVVIATWLAEPLRLIASLNLILTLLYSFWLKRTVLAGNMTMAFLNSSIILFGALAGDGASPIIWSVCVSIFLYSLAQEVLYTIGDRVGDALAGIMTTAIAMGEARALLLFRVLLGCAALSAFLPLWLGVSAPSYVLALLLCNVGPIFLWILPLTGGPGGARIDEACRAVKVVRVASLCPLLFLEPV
ncbi:MAG TPA: UbiA family prenyltransferase [Chloroflexaceae bacterium]|nr:UbiA family prenyltransferase [Chloroflexaceae bacterium]